MSDLTLGPEQIASLAVYQEGLLFHPYTCPDHDDIPGHIKLLPGFKFWTCAHEYCSYTQPYTDKDAQVAEMMFQAISAGDYPAKYMDTSYS